MEQKSKATAFLLCYFLGFLGVHRFYLNRIISGVLMLVTGGGLGLWWLIDSILLAANKLTDSNKQPLRVGAPDPQQPNAGFWVRVAAMSVDSLILMAVALVLGIGATFAFPIALTSTGEPDPMAAMPIVAVTYGGTFIIALLYFAVQTASQHQATIGKRAFALKVTSRASQPLGILRALWRSLCYVVSAIPFYLGFVLAGFGARKLALHDYLAATQVLYADVANTTVAVTTPAAVAPQSPRVESVATATAAGSSPLLLVVVGALLIGAAGYVAILG